MPANKPKIIDRTIPPVPYYVKTVLTRMFLDCKEIVVRSVLQSDISGSRLLLVRPITEEGPKLPVVVKVDRVGCIKQEWTAYKEYIQNRLPNIVEISSDPIYPPGSSWGGLCYPWLGADKSKIENLYQFCQYASTKDICRILESSLFNSLNELWMKNREVRPYLHLQTHYDSFLPANLIVELQEVPVLNQTKWLHPENVNDHKWIVNDQVQLFGFRIVNINYQKQQLSLDIPLDLNAAFKIQLYPVSNIESYELDEVIEKPFTGIIRRTREEQLEKKAAAVLGPSVNLKGETISLPGGTTLPNPLTKLSEILSQIFDANVSLIHGELNLFNILIETETKKAYLIDFSHARKDHILCDLICLEASVITQYLPDVLAKEKKSPSIIGTLYEGLHCALTHSLDVIPPSGLEKPFAILKSIRGAARYHLSEKNNWNEYYYGLFIQLLGALKFNYLDGVSTAPYPKQLAFLGAAVTSKIIENPPRRDAFPIKKSDAGKRKDRVKGENIDSRPRNETIIYGPVSGPFHSGTGDIIINDKPGSEDVKPRRRPWKKNNK